MPSDSGVTSSSSTSLTSPFSTPAWIAAPTATASSGFTSLRGSLPKNSRTLSTTLGMRVWPPTRITSCDVLHADAGVLDRDAAGLDRLLDQIVDQRLELGAGDLHVEVLRPALVGRDVGQVDLGLLRGRELDLRLLGRLLEPLQRDHVLRQVDALVLLELVDDVVDQALVEVLAAEERVAVGGEHLELLLALDVGDLDDRDVERAAAQVVHRDLLVLLGDLVHAERERRRRGLVDDALHVEAGDAAGVLGRLALRVVEVGRDRDHRLLHFLAEVVLGGLLHLAQDVRRDLLRRDLLAAHLDPGVAVVGARDLVGHQLDVLLRLLLVELAADEPLHRVDGVLGVGDRLALGRRADQHLAVVGEGDDRGGRARAFRVLDHLGLAALHDRDAGVRGSEVDADDLCHWSP